LSEEQIRYYVRDELRKILDKGLMYSAEVKPQPKPQKLTATEIADKFPENLRKHLTINTGDSETRISTAFVSREYWDQMNEIAKELGFSWVSAGKDSHWRKK